MPRPSVNPQYIILFHHFRLFLERAAAKQIDIAPLKGAHLLTGVYPEGEDRGTLADVDFLVHPEDWDTALQILRELGFTPRRTRPGRPVSDREYHETAFYLSLENGRQIMFEPHRYLVQSDRLKLDHDAIWARSTPSEFDGAPCRRLASIDHFLYGMLHLVTNSFIAPGRELRDLTLLIERGGVCLDDVIRQVDTWQLRRGAWLTLTLLEEQTPALVSTRQLDQLKPPLWIRRYLRYLVPDSNGFRFPKMRLRMQQLVIWPVLFDGVLSYMNYARRYATLRARDALENRLKRAGRNR